MLSNLKKWFSSLSKETQKPPYISEYFPPLDDYSGVDLRFYTKEYSMTPEDRKVLLSLVQTPEFRTFEKYMDWRINACAHRMKALLLQGEKEKAAYQAAEIEAIVKVTTDMQNFWTEAKILDLENNLTLEKKNRKRPKAFGAEKITL